MTQILIRDDGSRLAYDQFVPDTAKSPVGIVFMHGFQSDRKATKASYMADICRTGGIPFIAFDFYAHGESDGLWPDFTIGRAVHDALTVLDTLTTGPQIIIGSSMGGWVALRVMEERPERVAGLVGVAAAPDFTLWVERDATPEQALAEGFTQTLLTEAHHQTVMDEHWAFDGPVHLLQGQMDTEVPWETANAIKAKFPNPDKVTVTFVPDGDHRLNRPEDLALLNTAYEDVKNRI